MMLIAVMVVWLAMVSACTIPPYITSLDEILEREGITNRTRYGHEIFF
jgi:hypothetical protein